MTTEPLQLALLVFVVAPAVILGAAAFVATVTEPTVAPTVEPTANPTVERKSDNDA